MSWRDAISWHEEGHEFSSSKYIFTQTKSTTQNFDMKNFIITIFLIFAIGKAGGKGNSSELSEGIMHYFHSYALFSHKNQHDNYHFGEVFEESHEPNLQTSEKESAFPCFRVHSLVAQQQNRFEVLCCYSIALWRKAKIYRRYEALILRLGNLASCYNPNREV